jgi:predicted nicotinamide N-methyase
VLRATWEPELRVLEIGCGIGLVGLAAAARGHLVTFSDHIPLAVSLALENARRNGFLNSRGLWLDWHQPIAEEFPVILASDVLYEAKLHSALLELIQRMLAPQGFCWIGDPVRYHARSFIEHARSRGFNVQVQENPLEPASSTTASFQLIVLRRAGTP